MAGNDTVPSNHTISDKAFAVYNALPPQPRMLTDRDKIIRESYASVTAHSSCGDLPHRSVHPPSRHSYGLQHMEKGQDPLSERHRGASRGVNNAEAIPRVPGMRKSARSQCSRSLHLWRSTRTNALDFRPRQTTIHLCPASLRGPGTLCPPDLCTPSDRRSDPAQFVRLDVVDGFGPQACIIDPV
jgi:hypothetical protein